MFKNWHYVVNCHTKFGHCGRYPLRFATWLAAMLTAHTGKQYDTQDRAMYLADIAWNKRFGPGKRVL